MRSNWWSIKDYAKDEDGERSLYAPDGFDVYGVDRCGARRNGLSGKITKSTFSTLSEDGLETLLLECQNSYKQLIENEKIEKTLKNRTPLDRLVKTIVEVTLKSTYMKVDENGKVTLDIKKMARKIYFNLYEKIFETKCELTEKQVKNNVNKLLKSIAIVAYSQKIDIDKIFSDVEEEMKRERDYSKKYRGAIAEYELEKKIGKDSVTISEKCRKMLRIEGEIIEQKKIQMNK